MNTPQKETAGSERETLPAFTSIDEMCAILAKRLIKAYEHTDCGINYLVTFEQLRGLYDAGRAALSHPAAQAGAVQAARLEGLHGFLLSCAVKANTFLDAATIRDWAKEIASLAATQPSAAAGDGQGLQLIGWEYRHLDTANTPNRWSEWERCRARNRHTSTDEDFAQEIRAYIKSGFNYEVREIYAAAPGAAIAAREQEALTNDNFAADWLTNRASLHPHTINLVVRFARALAGKLAAAEKKYGYSDGWLSPDWMDECRTKLQEHIAKGDQRDVAAYCAFLWHHGESTASPAAAPTSQREKFMEVQPDGTTTEEEPDDCCRINTFKSSICAHGTKGCDLLHLSLTSQPNAAAQEQQAGWMPIESAPKGQQVLLYSERDADITIDDWAKYARYNNPNFSRWMPLPPAPAPTGMGSVGLPSGRGEEA